MPTPRKYASNAERQSAYRARCALRMQRGTTLAVSSATEGQQQLPPILLSVGHTRWNAVLKTAHSLLERVAYEMEGYYDERSEKWQESERGESFTERMGAVEEAASLVEELI